MILDDNGKERLLIEGQILGNPKGLGRLGARRRPRRLGERRTR